MKLYMKPADIYRRPTAIGPQPGDELLIETDRADVGQVVKIDGETYVVCILGGKSEKSPGYTYGFVEPVTLTDRKRCDETDMLECPVCGWKNDDSWELEDRDDRYECGHCGAILSYESETVRTFNCVVVKCPEVHVLDHMPEGSGL